MSASNTGDDTTVTALLDSGADPNFKDIVRESWKHSDCICGEIRACRIREFNTCTVHVITELYNYEYMYSTCYN